MHIFLKCVTIPLRLRPLWDVYLQSERMAQAFLWREEIAKCVGACSGEGRKALVAYIITHSLCFSGKSPHHHHLSSSPSLPPSHNSFCVGLCALFPNDLQNNGVTSCSRSQCFQQSVEPSRHQTELVSAEDV